MTLHAIGSRDQVSGEWVTRCGLRGYKDLRPPLGSPRGRYRPSDPFYAAQTEGQVDCPGCVLPLTDDQKRALRALYQLGGMATWRNGDLDWNDAVRPPVLWAHECDVSELNKLRLLQWYGPYIELRAHGHSLAKTYPEVTV